MAQSKTLLRKLWTKHIEPLNKHQGGGISLGLQNQPDPGKGFYYRNELEDLDPSQFVRGDTIFILHPGSKVENFRLVPSVENGHWSVLTMKSAGPIYFDPDVHYNGVPTEIQNFLNRFEKPYIIDQSSPQSFTSLNSKAFESCGLYCIKFLKLQYAGSK